MPSKTNREDDETNVALYKVEYKISDEIFSIYLILSKNKKSRTSVKKIISSMTNSTYKDIKDVKFKFRKNVEGFAPGINGTKLYNITLAREKQIRKEMGQLKRIYSRYYLKQHPFNAPSKTMSFSRHLYISIDDLYENIRQNHQRQKYQYRFDIQFGLILRNNQTDETRQYYPSYNTSFYNDSGIPIINNSIEK
jgi:hypothetical protein